MSTEGDLVKLTYQGFFSTEESPMREARAAVNLVGAGMADKPIVLGYTPVGRTNPYQALLYKELTDQGIAAVPIVKSWDFAKIGQISDQSSLVVLHIHWTSFILNNIKSYGTAKKKINDFKSDVDGLLANGGQLIWTLHNIVPHNAQFMDLEMEIQQYLADKASVIHVMSEASVEMMSEAISFERSKILHIPHPSYSGTYEDFVNRETARATLGLTAQDRVYVLLGALKAYKGLSRLLAAFEELCRLDPSVSRKLLVGGIPDDEPEVKQFIQDCEASPNVLIEAKKVPANFVQFYMRAADVGLAPYARMLNSGAILLYQTFDLPVVASNVPAIWENLSHDIAEMAADSSVEALVEALQRADRFIGSDVGLRVRSHVQQYDASEQSREFARELRSMLQV
ncbi:MAG: hypothetical protein JWO93_775 [Micrococcaceae bacterium]|jgi:beta-1,4-mannosyltransferase|nr:hypothetical protein [Micrococcaceae bacterium]